MLYGKEYYDKHLGPVPCTWDSPEWNQFFENIAKSIKLRFNPTTVMDVGCALGFLVKKFRAISVQAFGFDYSDYAVGVARENGLDDFCVQKADLSNYKIEKQYDVVVCIEVLEHIYAEFAEQCIKTLCELSKQYIVFSSSSDDKTEETHVNIQDTEYWLDLFGKYGFYKIEDAPYVCPWAIVLQKVDVQ